MKVMNLKETKKYSNKNKNKQRKRSFQKDQIRKY